jgi:hypothetical protein
MLHTIQEAVILTGKSRRTIYDHCTAGRVSYSVGDDSRRYFETSELIRVYGPLRGSAHPEPMQTAQARTPSNEAQAEAIAAAVSKGVAEAVAPLIARLGELESTLRLLEYRPAPVEQPPNEFAGLIASLKARH